MGTVADCVYEFTFNSSYDVCKGTKRYLNAYLSSYTVRLAKMSPIFLSDYINEMI